MTTIIEHLEEVDKLLQEKIKTEVTKVPPGILTVVATNNCKHYLMARWGVQKAISELLQIV